MQPESEFKAKYVWTGLPKCLIENKTIRQKSIAVNRSAIFQRKQGTFNKADIWMHFILSKITAKIVSRDLRIH